jgi:hypothetical protein
MGSTAFRSGGMGLVGVATDARNCQRDRDKVHDIRFWFIALGLAFDDQGCQQTLKILAAYRVRGEGLAEPLHQKL